MDRNDRPIEKKYQEFERGEIVRFVGAARQWRPATFGESEGTWLDIPSATQAVVLSRTNRGFNGLDYTVELVTGERVSASAFQLDPCGEVMDLS